MRKLLLSLALLLIGMNVEAQSESIEDFVKRAKADMKDFIDKANEDYAKFLANPWEEFELRKKQREEEKIDPPTPYVPNPEDDEREDEFEIEEFIIPEDPQPQPEPVKPVAPQPNVPTDVWHDFVFFGTKERVRLNKAALPHLRGNTDEENLANTWNAMSDYPDMKKTLSDCLAIRTNRKLCDWAYLKMLDALANSVCSDPNDEIVFVSYLYCQSGYKIRMGRDQKGNLDILYGTKHFVCEGCFELNDGYYYAPVKSKAANMYISQVSFPGEQFLSLQVPNQPILDVNTSSLRHITSQRYPDMNHDARINKNLLEFYNSYPTSYIGDNIVTRWAMYANTPISPEVNESLYASINNLFRSTDKVQNVKKALNWMQTGFVYEFDDKVWGKDRAFFAEETLYYPYADCEDRAILFSKIVRDIIGLDVILVYYPGHLAAAVAFDTPVNGDYIMYKNRKFTICDPTYIGADIGMTMPKMDNAKALAVILERKK